MNTHEFPDTGTAYDQTQCRDDIKHGDVLYIPSERVVGVLNQAWPMAVTVEKGDLHARKAGSSWEDVIQYCGTEAERTLLHEGVNAAMYLAVALDYQLSDEQFCSMNTGGDPGNSGCESWADGLDGLCSPHREAYTQLMASSSNTSMSLDEDGRRLEWTSTPRNSESP